MKRNKGQNLDAERTHSFIKTPLPRSRSRLLSSILPVGIDGSTNTNSCLLSYHGRAAVIASPRRRGELLNAAVWRHLKRKNANGYSGKDYLIKPHSTSAPETAFSFRFPSCRTSLS